MKNIEVELKFQVLNLFEIDKFLGTFQFVDKKRIVDFYLDTKKGDLYKKGIFIRIRDGKKLEFKVNLADFQQKDRLSYHEHCSEFSFPLPLVKSSVGPVNKICQTLSLTEITSPDLKELKNKNDLIDSVVIDKVRQRYKDIMMENLSTL